MLTLNTIVFIGLALQATHTKDILIADFEGSTYGAWKVEGTAFGTGPAHGTLPNQMRVTGYLGKGLVNSFNGGDDATGTLTSPAFKIQRRYINFLIGGGKYPGKTCINLLIDGKVVRTETGPNDQPGGTEALAWKYWDVADLTGKSAQVQIVDQAKGGWGHINVDEIMESDQKKEPVRMERVIEVNKRYLHWPVKNGAPPVRVRIDVDGKWAQEFTIELAPADPDFWVFSDVSGYHGKKLTLSLTETSGPNPLDAVKTSNSVPGASSLYHEKLRPQFHFSSRVGWLNDPNGLVYLDGEYHLFYQHNPYGWAWGNMHWGHAVSTDLLHWKELPIAIYPHQWDDWVFSGSAVVDSENTSGFGKDGTVPMVAAFTSTGRGESIAYSLDKGRTFTEYPKNPVIKHEGRDPKVIWYAPGKHWVLALYDEFQGKQSIAFYSSTDLKNWHFESRIDGFFECPEIFEIPVEGQPGKTRWVIYAADGGYRVGDFDGKTFHPEASKQPLSHGNLFYASQTYNHMPDGRRVQIAWGRAETPGMPFNQCMLFPSELTLHETAIGMRLFANPAREIQKIYRKSHRWQAITVTEAQPCKPDVKNELLDLSADISVGTAKQVGLYIHGIPLVYDVEKGELTYNGSHASLPVEHGHIRLRILLDRTTTEIYANAGSVYMPVGAIHLGDPQLAVFVQGGQATLDSLEIHELAPSMTAK